MKNIFWLASIVVVFSSCGSDEETKKNETGKSDSLVSTVELRDTITCSVEPIDETFYCKQTKGMGFCVEKGKNVFVPDSLTEFKLLQANAQLIQKNGNDMIIKSDKGEIKFTNNPDHNSDDFIEYHLSEVNNKFVTLIIYYYESFEYMVVNCETGKSFKTWGLPVFNKERTMAVAGNFDLMAGFTNNGIQLFGQDAGGWNLKMQWIVDDWGPGYLAWMNDSVIVGKKFVPDESDTVDGVRTDFVKINLRKEKIN
jgi:hypothetical protein